jgi:hypothetical protein
MLDTAEVVTVGIDLLLTCGGSSFFEQRARIRLERQRAPAIARYRRLEFMAQLVFGSVRGNSPGNISRATGIPVRKNTDNIDTFVLLPGPVSTGRCG